MSASSFLVRWNLSLLRKEWRQQLGVLFLVAIGTALSVGAIVASFNLTEPPGSRFGNGKIAATITGDATDALTGLAAQTNPFGAIQSVVVKAPGSAIPIGVRSQDPANSVTAPLLALADGSWPAGPEEIAVTDGAPTASRAIGELVDLGGSDRKIVGVVENPTNLNDEFVLTSTVESFGVERRFQATQLFVDAPPQDITFPPGTFNLSLEHGGDGPAERTIVAVAVSMVMGIALLIVSLMSGAAFAVLARKRARQYGLLAAAGATPRQVRHAVMLTGFLTGLTAAAVGCVVGLAVTAAVVPRFETTVAHRIDFAAPWWTVIPTFVLALAATTVAAWWPSLALSRQAVVDVLSSMRPRPSPTAGSTTLGVIGTVVGAAVLVYGVRSLSATFVIVGLILAVLGLLLLSPGLVRAIGRRAKSLPLAGRMAGRAIARQQGRSAAFIAALALALAIPVGVATVTASIDRHNAEAVPNLENNMAIVWLPGVEGETLVIPVEVDDASVQAVGDRVSALDSGLTVAPIQVVAEPNAEPFAVNLPDVGLVPATQTIFSLTPVDPDTCGTSCNVNTLGDRDADGNEILVSFHDAWVADPGLLGALNIAPEARQPGQQAISRLDDAMITSHRNQSAETAPNVAIEPGIPANTSLAPTLIWPELLVENGQEAVTIGWLVVDDAPLSPALLGEIKEAAGDTMLTEASLPLPTSTGIRSVAIATGLLIGLGITLASLALLRSESADDVRLLQAIGAGPKHHRSLSAMTAGILAVASVLIALPTGSLAVLVLLVDAGTDFEFVVPWLSLAALVLLMPALATAIGWATSTTQTTNLGRRLT